MERSLSGFLRLKVQNKRIAHPVTAIIKIIIYLIPSAYASQLPPGQGRAGQGRASGTPLAPLRPPAAPPQRPGTTSPGQHKGTEARSSLLPEAEPGRAGPGEAGGRRAAGGHVTLTSSTRSSWPGSTSTWVPALALTSWPGDSACRRGMGRPLCSLLPTV